MEMRCVTSALPLSTVHDHSRTGIEALVLRGDKVHRTSGPVLISGRLHTQRKPVEMGMEQ